MEKGEKREQEWEKERKRQQVEQEHAKKTVSRLRGIPGLSTARPRTRQAREVTKRSEANQKGKMRVVESEETEVEVGKGVDKEGEEDEELAAEVKAVPTCCTTHLSTRKGALASPSPHPGLSKRQKVSEGTGTGDEEGIIKAKEACKR